MTGFGEVRLLFNNVKRSRFLLRIFLSLILIAVIILSVFCLLVYKVFLTEYKNDVIVNKLSELNSIHNTINDRLNEMLRVAVEINSNYEFSYYPRNQYFDQGSIMVNELKKYQTSNKFIKEIAYYRESEHDKIYLTLGEPTIEQFFKHLYQYKTLNTENFLDRITSGGSLYVHPSEEVIIGSTSVELLTFVFGLPFNTANPKRFIVFFVENQSIHNIVTNLFNRMEGSLYILNDKQKPIYSYRNNSKSIPSEILLNSISDRTSIETTIDGTKYLVFRKTSEYNNWTYIAAINTDQMLINFYNKRNFFLLSVNLVLVVIITSAIIMAMYNYKPLYDLVNSISNHTKHKLDSNQQYDEMKYIEQIVETTINNKRELQKRLFFSNLIWGQFDDVLSLNFAMQDAEVCMDFNKFVACTISFNYLSEQSECIESEFDLEGFLRIIESFFDNNNLQSVGVDIYDKSKIAIVINYENKDITIENIVEIFGDINGYFINKFNVNMTVGIGTECDNILNISNSFSKSRQAVFYCAVQSEESVFIYDLINNDNIVSLPRSYKQDLVKAIKRGNSDLVVRKISQIKNYFTENNLENEQIKHLCYNILNYILNISDTVQLDVQDDIQKMAVKVLGQQSLTTDVMYEDIQEICLKITKAFHGSSNEKKDTQLKSKILEIIDKRLCDNTLSLESLAADCNVTPSYIGRYFKQQTGYSPMQYVDLKRMKFAKDLLINSNDPLKLIVEKSGYVDESNFIRKFKKVEGVTPIKYRHTFSELQAQEDNKGLEKNILC